MCDHRGASTSRVDDFFVQNSVVGNNKTMVHTKLLLVPGPQTLKVHWVRFCKTKTVEIGISKL